MYKTSWLARPLPLFSVLFAFLFSILPHVFAQTTQSLAVLDLEGRGISNYEAASLTDRLRSELVNTGRVTIVERGRMEQILTEQNFQLTGCTSDECAVEVGQLLGVTTMVAGSVGKVGSTFSLDIRTIDVATGEITRSIMRDYRGEIDGLLREMGHLARTLAQVSGQELVAQQPEPVPQESLQPAATRPTLEETKGPLFMESRKAEQEVSAPGPASTEKIYTYMFGGGLFSRSWNKSNFNPPTYSFSAGYYPRSFPADKPVGLLPFNNRNGYFTLESNRDEDYSSYDFDSRFVLWSRWDFRGTYYRTNWEDNGNTGGNTSITLGLGAYFGKSYLSYAQENYERSDRSTQTVHGVRFSQYPSDYHALYVDLFSYDDEWVGSDSIYTNSGRWIILGTRQLSSQWVYYDFQYGYYQYFWGNSGESTEHRLTGELAYYPNRTLLTGIGFDMWFDPDRGKDKLLSRTLSVKVSKYLSNLFNVTLEYSQTNYPRSKYRNYSLNIAYLL